MRTYFVQPKTQREKPLALRLIICTEYSLYHVDMHVKKFMGYWHKVVWTWFILIPTHLHIHDLKESSPWWRHVWSSQSGSWQRILSYSVWSRETGPSSNKSESRSPSPKLSQKKVISNFVPLPQGDCFLWQISEHNLKWGNVAWPSAECASHLGVWRDQDLGKFWKLGPCKLPECCAAVKIKFGKPKAQVLLLYSAYFGIMFRYLEPNHWMNLGGSECKGELSNQRCSPENGGNQFAWYGVWRCKTLCLCSYFNCCMGRYAESRGIITPFQATEVYY